LQSKGATQYLFQNKGDIQYGKTHQEYLFQNEGENEGENEVADAIQYKNDNNNQQQAEIFSYQDPHYNRYIQDPIKPPHSNPCNYHGITRPNWNINEDKAVIGLSNDPSQLSNYI
jgi:hypothetical protein